MPRQRLRQPHQRQHPDFGAQSVQPVRRRSVGRQRQPRVLRPSTAGVRRPPVLPGDEHLHVFARAWKESSVANGRNFYWDLTGELRRQPRLPGEVQFPQRRQACRLRWATRRSVRKYPTACRSTSSVARARAATARSRRRCWTIVTYTQRDFSEQTLKNYRVQYRRRPRGTAGGHTSASRRASSTAITKVPSGPIRSPRRGETAGIPSGSTAGAFDVTEFYAELNIPLLDGVSGADYAEIQHGGTRDPTTAPSAPSPPTRPAGCGGRSRTCRCARRSRPASVRRVSANCSAARRARTSPSSIPAPTTRRSSVPAPAAATRRSRRTSTPTAPRSACRSDWPRRTRSCLPSRQATRSSRRKSRTTTRSVSSTARRGRTTRTGRMALRSRSTTTTSRSTTPYRAAIRAT